jgi:poly(3-hydroxybutyrate) depolymerase
MRGTAGYSFGNPRPERRSPRHIAFHGSGDHTVVPANAARLMNIAREVHPTAEVSGRVITSGGMKVQLTVLRQADGAPVAESWLVQGAGHHWIGGDPAGSFAKSGGPSAAREMMRFFLGRQPRA